MRGLWRLGKGRSSAFVLPPSVAELVRQGKELGEEDDIVFGKTNSKQANGAVYTEAACLAFIPFKNTELY